MAIKHVLNAETRERFGKNEMNRLRSEGRVPAILYGPDQKPTPISVDTREVGRLLQEVTFENTIIDLKVTGTVHKSFQTLIREVQQHPYRMQLEHLDFYCVPKGRKLHVEVPIILHGMAVGVRSHGGMVQHLLRDLEIEVLPENIPEHFVVDISGLDINQGLRVKDLPKGDYEILVDPERTVVSISPPALIKETVEAEAAPEGEAVTEPEVIGREKESEEQ
jgi:large subunit ribosomal protein L25